MVGKRVGSCSEFNRIRIELELALDRARALAGAGAGHKLYYTAAFELADAGVAVVPVLAYEGHGHRNDPSSTAMIDDIGHKYAKLAVTAALAMAVGQRDPLRMMQSARQPKAAMIHGPAVLRRLQPQQYFRSPALPYRDRQR